MKLIIILFAILIISCGEQPRAKQPQITYVQKIVKNKKEAIKTSHRYKYNIFKDNFYHQPNVQTVYYIMYTDGSLDMVSIDKYLTTEIGDTITDKVIIYK